MRILITGGRGQLGIELQRILQDNNAEKGKLPSVYESADVTATSSQDLDITNKEAVLNYIQKGNFDLIINGAAMTNVDGCETCEEEAMLVNGEAPGYLAEAAEKIGAKFVQVSTDYVFSGTNPIPRVETDETGPVSVYGKSKLVGEERALKKCTRCFVVRTAWLYGYQGKNFVKTMRHLGSSRDEVTVVYDQLGNPTSANDLAHELLRIAATENYGIYHCTNKGTCSWADFAQAIMDGSGLNCKVNRCTSSEYAKVNPQAAQRPAFSSLHNKHLEETIGDEMRTWEDALNTYLENLSQLEG